MTNRQRAIKIMELLGEPIEPNSHCDALINLVVRILDKRRTN